MSCSLVMCRRRRHLTVNHQRSPSALEDLAANQRRRTCSSRWERMATDQTVLGGWINGDRATIRIEGTYDGTRAVADIDLTREAGTWKIAEQHRWQAVGD